MVQTESYLIYEHITKSFFSKSIALSLNITTFHSTFHPQFVFVSPFSVLGIKLQRLNWQQLYFPAQTKAAPGREKERISKYVLLYIKSPGSHPQDCLSSEHTQLILPKENTSLYALQSLCTFTTIYMYKHKVKAYIDTLR